MNSSQNEIVEKLIGKNINHGFGSFTETEIYNLTNINPTSTVLGIINKFCKAKSAKDIEYINKRISDWKGTNIDWQNKIRKILNKIRHKYKDQLPSNIRISKTTIQWKEEGDISIDNAHELSMEEEETKTPQTPMSAQAPIESSKQTNKDKDVDLKDKVPKYVPNKKETSKPVDIPKSPIESSKKPDEIGEKDVDKAQNEQIDALKDKVNELDKKIEESAKKPITKEEEKKIKEFQEKHNKNLKESALKDIIKDRRTKNAYSSVESTYGPEAASEMVPEIKNVKDIKPLTDEEKDKVKEELKDHNEKAKRIEENKNATADYQHEHTLLNKAFKGMKRIEEIPFDKEAFNRNLDAIQMVVNLIKREAITDKNKINKMVTPYITGKWLTAKGGKVEKQDLSYNIPNNVRAAHRKYIKQKIDEILAQIDCHINIEPLDKKTKSGYKAEGRARVSSGAESAAKYRELKGIKPQTVNDEETFFIYDNSHIDSIIEDFIQKRISKKYHMSDEAKSNINALINNETKTLRNTGSDKHGAAAINSKFINELAKPIEEYINSKINRTAIAKSKKLSEDEKLQHMKKFRLSPVTKMKLEEILLRDTANLHPDSKESKEDKHGISKKIISFSYHL